MKIMELVIKNIRIISLLLSILFSNAVLAIGSSAQPDINLTHDAQDIIDFSNNFQQQLAQRRVRVAIVSRSGRADNELPSSVEYTHVGFAVYSQITLEDGTTQPGYAMYNLYQIDGALNRSSLVQDFPFDFFSQVYKLQAGVIIPSEELQTRLVNIINSQTYNALHNPRYSAIANPFNNEAQNCTEFVLNVVQSAIYQTDDMVVLKDSLKSYFEPYRIPYNPFAIILGAAFSNEFKTTDHDGPFQTATFSSIKKYFEKNNLAKEVLRLEI